jgi:hypothetical protein
VHIIGLPPPPIFPYTNGPILAAIHVQWRWGEKIRKNYKTKKEKKKKEKKRELLPFLVANDEEKWVGKEPVNIVGWFRMCRTKQWAGKTWPTQRRRLRAWLAGLWYT